MRLSRLFEYLQELVLLVAFYFAAFTCEYLGFLICLLMEDTTLPGSVSAYTTHTNTFRVQQQCAIFTKVRQQHVLN